MTGAQAVREFLRFPAEFRNVAAELRSLVRESPRVRVALENGHIIDAIAMVMDDRRRFVDLVDWANVLESLEEIDATTVAQEVICELANAEINGLHSAEDLKRIVALLTKRE